MIPDRRKYLPKEGGVRLILALLLLFIFGALSSDAQSTKPHPLDGRNQISLTGSFGISGGQSDEGSMIPADPSIDLGGITGEESVVGIRLSRPMPDFFISRGMTVHAGLEYLRYSLTRSGSGVVELEDDRPGVSVSQQSHLRADILALSVGIRINTSKGRGRVMPTVDLGASFGHVLGLDLETRTDPEIGFPEDGFVPDRRYYYNSINVGLGLGLSLGQPDRSIMLVPSLALRAATTSLTRNPDQQIFPLTIQGGVEVRIPIQSDD